MERVAATRSIVVVLVVVSSLFVLSLARRTIDQLPGDAEGSASSLQTLASPNLLLLPRGQSDQDPDKRTNLEEAAAAEEEEEDDPATLAVPDRRPPDADLEAPRSAGTDAASLPAAAAAAAEEEEENAVAGAEADRSSAEVMGWIPKEKEGERAKKRGKKPCDSDSNSDSESDSDSDSDSYSDSDDEEEEDEGEAKKKMKKKKEKGKGGFLRWFWRLVNRF